MEKALPILEELSHASKTWIVPEEVKTPEQESYHHSNVRLGDFWLVDVNSLHNGRGLFKDEEYIVIITDIVGDGTFEVQALEQPEGAGVREAGVAFNRFVFQFFAD